MRVVVSNLAWEPDQDEDVAAILRRHGVAGIEIAPTKWWPQPLEADAADVAARRRHWEDAGLPVVSMQSLLFGQPDLHLFAEDPEPLVAYLDGIIQLAAATGAGPLVLGSPKNRLRGERSFEQALDQAVPVLARLGRSAAAAGTCLCIEPNPVDYGCDFVTDAAEGTALVRRVGEPGFGLHLDTGGMTLAGDDVAAAITGALDVLRHVHCSEPGLAPAGSTGRVDHRAAAAALRDGGYEGVVSVEMLVPAGDDHLQRLEDAVAFAVATYG